MLEEDEQAATGNSTVQHLRPVTGCQITTRVVMLCAGHRLAFPSAEVSDESQAIVATPLTAFARQP